MDAHGRGGDQEKVSFLLDHLPNSLPAYSPACAAVGFLSSKAELMMLPSSSSCLISSSSGGGDGGKSLEQDFDSLDCESEEAVEVFEEPVKPVPTRCSGSKRSRAAEVHNMSEKRRRSRINEKMRALQNLIPNSNKTDKASMLDEAIEYLKQLQLQVQILSMRNGLNLHSMYMSGALQPLQSSPLSIGFGQDNDLATNIGSFDIPNQCASSHQSTAVTPALISVADPEAPLVNSSHSHHGSFQLPVPSCEAIFAGDISEQMQLAAVQYTQNLSENERTAVAAAIVKRVGGQTSSSSQIGINQLEEGMLGKEGGRRRRPQEQPANEETFIQHLHALQELFHVLMSRKSTMISVSDLNASLSV